MTGAAVEVEGLVQRVGDRPVLAVERWAVPAAGGTLVRGPSGSGKTTLLNLLAGLVRPSEGRVRVLGEDIGRLPGPARDRLRGRRIGIVFQTLHLVRPLDVLGNLQLAAFLGGTRPGDGPLRELLARVGLADRAAALPWQLSQGEAQRVAIARALVNRPALILADEPTSALDDASCAAVVDLLVEVAAEAGAALVLATHDRRLENRFETKLELGPPA